MKKLLQTLILISSFIAINSYATSIFKVKVPPIQNMVANSTQSLAFVLSTQATSAVNIHCTFTSTSPNLTASFNSNGCTSTGGVGINSTTPDTVTITLTTAATAIGSITGTVTFTQTNGRHESQQYAIPITIPTSTNRTITFKNLCPFAVTFAVSSGALPAKNKPTIPCTSNAQCTKYYNYSTCVNGFCGGGACQSDNDCENTNGGTCKVPAGQSQAHCTYCNSSNDCMAGSDCDLASHTCYWLNPTPADAATKNYQLNAYPGTGTPDQDTVQLTDNSATNGYSIIWSGGFGGRTGCNFAGGINTCSTGNCNITGAGDGNGGCNLAENLQQPATLSEATFQNTTPDTYDVTVINGLNIPVAVHPTANNAASPSAYENPYICGTPGGTTETKTVNGNVGACSWEYTPPNLAFRWVGTETNTPCSDEKKCTDIDSKYRCGFTRATITGNSAQKTCGLPLGYWNQNQVCVENTAYNADPNVVDCTPTNIGSTGNSMLNLLRCTGPAAASCFNIGSASTTCCGCTNWQDQNIIVPTKADIVQQCKYPNSYWGGGTLPATGNVLPGLVWIKQACPSSYVYPFDDKTSTYTCPGNGGQSAVNYTVEFCPGQKTAGIPAS
ncbi:MAG: hypothetical protein KDH94_03660 [Coxiellaceae bacterium]|nr:hypothetical protein [Coxiellaceae bacterium]